MSRHEETQYQIAQHMYADRAADYENSWHPEYTKRFMSLVDIKPGQHVLILACGTGLEAEIAAPAVGDDGIVVGVDATAEMLNEVRRKQEADPVLEQRLKLYQHDINDLSECEGVEKASFDWIICSNAFVLLEEPAKVVSHWCEYLRPTGQMAIDITHETYLPQSLILEKIMTGLGHKFPSHRAWIESRDSFCKILEQQGLVVERVEELEKEPGKGSQFLDVSASKEQFEYITSWPQVKSFISDELKAKIRPLFEQEWAAIANSDGKVEISESLYAYIARKV